MDKINFKVSIKFLVRHRGDWNDDIVASEALINVAVDELGANDKPVDYLKGQEFSIIFLKDFPDKVDAFSWAKTIEEKLLNLWKEKIEDLKRAKTDPNGTTIEPDKPAEPAEAL